ncbi:MAG: MFS transporter [Gammaproteobacteria bacterium]|nr:MFS transporter [Gammaproteobacteria bacterium]
MPESDVSRPVPYWRISGFYLFYFASLGVIVPYWGLYLQSLNFDARAIGELMAVIMATKIVAPYLWSWMADHSGRSMRIIRIGSVCAALVFAGVFLNSGFWWLALVMALFSFFWNATLPQFEANTMNHLGKDTHHYSVIRLWGSLGFVLAVVVLGQVLDTVGYSLVPSAVFVLFIAIGIFSFLVPEAPAQQHEARHGSMLGMLKQPVVIALLLVCFLVQMSHGPYYTFYSIFLKQQGYDSSTLGWLWALGVVAEIIVFLYMHKLMPRFGSRPLLIAALLLTSVRWYLIGHFVDSFPIILLAQVLHAASFGLYHAVSIELFHRLFKGRLQGRGQALYSSISFGAGGAVGSYASGLMWDMYSPELIFNLAALAALLAFFIAWRFVKVAS